MRLQHGRGLVKLVVAHRHRIVAQQVHALEVGPRVLQVGLGHAGVDVAAVEQQAVATGLGNLGADAVDDGLPGGHAVLPVAVFPEAAMVVVGVHHGELVGGVARRSRRHQRTAREGEDQTQRKWKAGELHGVVLQRWNGLRFWRHFGLNRSGETRSYINDKNTF